MFYVFTLSHVFTMDTNEINTINTIAVKLPELWQSKVRSWFAQAEAQFVTSGVTMSLTKSYNMIKALEESSIERIPELLVPPADDPYSVLKHRLIGLFDLSDYERAELLMVLPQVDSDMPLHAARQDEGADAARRT